MEEDYKIIDHYLMILNCIFCFHQIRCMLLRVQDIDKNNRIDLE